MTEQANPTPSKKLPKIDESQLKDFLGGNDTASERAWLKDLGKQRDAIALEQYLQDEIQAAYDAKKPVLKMILTEPSRDLKTALLTALHNMSLTFNLRLVPGSVPRDVDIQGRLLPENLRGKVLIVKMGNKGGNLDLAHRTDNHASKGGGPGGYYVRPELIQAFGGPQRSSLVARDQLIYHTAYVTHAPRSFSATDAIKILLQCGVGVAAIDKVVYRKSTSRDDKTEHTYSSAIVEECYE